MFTGLVHYATQIHQSHTIKLQRFYCGASCGRQADHHCEILVPGKVLIPALFARMKQRRRQTGYWIGGGDLGSFTLIASITAKSQVLRHCRSAKTEWDDVVDRE